MNPAEFEAGSPKYIVLALALGVCSIHTRHWFDDLATPLDKSIKPRIETAIRLKNSWRFAPGDYPRRHAIEFMARLEEAHTAHIIHQTTKRLTA